MNVNILGQNIVNRSPVLVLIVRLVNDLVNFQHLLENMRLLYDLYILNDLYDEQLRLLQLLERLWRFQVVEFSKGLKVMLDQSILESFDLIFIG